MAGSLANFLGLERVIRVFCLPFVTWFLGVG